MKKCEKYKRKINRVCTIEFKDNIIKTADARGDLLGKIVKDRIMFEYDLIAAEAKYHRCCYVKFLNPVQLPSIHEKPLQDDKVIEAMKEIFFILKIMKTHNSH